MFGYPDAPIKEAAKFCKKCLEKKLDGRNIDALIEELKGSGYEVIHRFPEECTK